MMGPKGEKIIMPSKRDVITGRYVPKTEDGKKDGKQIVHPEKGKKWQIIADLTPFLGRMRRYKTFYGSESQVKVETQKFVNEPTKNRKYELI